MTPRDEERLIARYADDLMGSDERAEFERRMLADAGLRQAVDEQRDVNRWFAERRSTGDADDLRAPAGFAASVLAQTRRLPSREELRAELAPLGECDLAEVTRLARRLLVAAAVVLGLSLLVWGGLLKRPDPPHLEAADFDSIRKIDHAIEAEALRAADRSR